MSKSVMDQDALYYPYIHFRDEQWLRATLLYFPHIFRMVPPEYSLNDSEFVAQLARSKGRHGRPLIESYALNSFVAYQTGRRLADRLRTDSKDPDFRSKFSQEATRKGWHG